jgi:hypothetical protein
MGLKSNGTCQILVYAAGTQYKYHEGKEALVDPSNEVGLEVNAEKSKYILMSFQRNAGQNDCIEITNRPFEYVGRSDI